MTIDKNKKEIHNIFLDIFKYFIIGGIFIALITLIIDYAKKIPLMNLFFHLNSDLINSNITNFLTTQCSLTFIVLSLVSILSNKDEFVFWEDVITYKLKRPKYTNIIALSTYIITSLFAFILGYILGWKYYWTFLYFIIGIILLTWLTFISLATYFPNREGIKKKLKKNFYTEKNKKEKIDTIYSQTLFLLNSNDIRYITENISFLYYIIYGPIEISEEIKEYTKEKLSILLSQISRVEPEIFSKFINENIDTFIADMYYGAEIHDITLDSLKFLIINRQNPKARKLLIDLLKLYYEKKKERRKKEHAPSVVEDVIEVAKANGNMAYELFMALDWCHEADDLLGYNLLLESILDMAIKFGIKDDSNKELFKNTCSTFEKMDNRKFNKILSVKMLEKILNFGAINSGYKLLNGNNKEAFDYCLEKDNKKIYIDLKIYGSVNGVKVFLIKEIMSRGEKSDTFKQIVKSDAKIVYLLNCEDDEITYTKSKFSESVSEQDNLIFEQNFDIINFSSILKFAQGDNIFKI